MIVLSRHATEADRRYWAGRPVAVVVTTGQPPGLEEIAVCERHSAADWAVLANRHHKEVTR